MLKASHSDIIYIIEQVVLVVFVILSFVFLTLEQNFQLMIVAAFGHFMIGHYYQVKKKKPSFLKVLLFIILAFSCFYFTKNNPQLGLLVVTIIFTFHGYLDEHHIMGKPIDVLSYLFLFIIVLTHGLRFESYLYGREIEPFFSIWLMLSISIFMIYMIIKFFNKSLKFNPCLFLLLLLHIVFMCLYFQGNAPAASLIFRSIIIFHGARWYLYLGRKYYTQDKQKFKIYLKDILIGNIAIIVLYFLYKMYPMELSLLGYFVYSSTAYYAWALVHIFTTIRLNDYRLANLTKLSFFKS